MVLKNMFKRFLTQHRYRILLYLQINKWLCLLHESSHEFVIVIKFKYIYIKYVHLSFHQACYVKLL